MRFLRRFLPVLISVCMLTMPLVTASAADPKVVFSASTPDSNGLFTVSVTAYDATFEGIEFAIGYNKDVVCPASLSTGKTTTSASECIGKEKVTDAMSVFGTISENGKMIVLGYSEDDPDFTVTAGTDGTKLLTIQFKVIGQGSSGLCTEEDKNGSGLAHKYNMLPTTFVFNLPSSLSGGTTSSSSTTEQTMTKTERAKDTIILQIGNYAAAKDGSLCHIYSGEKQITPYINTDANGNGRTMIPIRFVAEELGATVGWDNGTKSITITMGSMTVKMTIGSNTYTVNGQSKTMDAVAEIKDCGNGSGNGRTMVPLRFVAEALGKSVCWDADNKLVIITDSDAPWQTNREAEKELTKDVLLITSPLLRDTIK